MRADNGAPVLAVREGIVTSPIARALIGKENGDIVDAQTPGGVKQYEILDVRYG